ncbi:uncharacterized protein LOC123923260 [Trifolium pratense]|uniref:uncharacterized protein LOC123923260 n=1 Tax=Trifolium pratense TaxID=57577 RepID=UPI001E693061|nr:uncharacterized protein LOC123923260 [Trifolium pratense]
MNSTWSEKIEYFIIPADGSTSPGIVELKRVPRCAHLVVGRNIYGEFSLWDITKLNCVSSFSASKYPISEFFPISLFDLQTKGLGLSYASIEEKAEISGTQSKERPVCIYQLKMLLCGFLSRLPRTLIVARIMFQLQVITMYIQLEVGGLPFW